MTSVAGYDGFDSIHFARDGSVLIVTIDRAGDDLNRVDGRLHHELARLFSSLREEIDARCVLLNAAGRAFSAGGDFAWFPELQESGAREALRLDARRLIFDLLDVPIPVVCAVNGPAVGLGASIALLCDAIFMARTASIADPHVQVGIVAGDGGTVAWPLAVGPARAKRYLLTGDPLPAHEAERLGLVTDVVDDERLGAEALAFAQRLAEGAPLALRYTKQAVNALVKDALNKSFDQATAHELVTFASDDHAEALAAFREKRPPRFRGR